jgi:hypothetical protein
MSYLLGAINKDTKKYENIVSVNKQNQYKCVGCNEDLILRKGEKKFQSFIHKNLNRCEYFKNPTPEQLLLDAKLFLKTLLETNKVDIFGECRICIKKIKMDIPEYNETKSIQMDYGFENDQMDLVYSDSEKKIICAFEVFNKQPIKPIEYPCYQIHMLELIHTQITCFATGKLELNCRKRDLCGQCTNMNRKIRKKQLDDLRCNDNEDLKKYFE